MRVLIEKGALMEAADTYAGWTALIFASQNGHAEAVRVLIEKGALIEAADEVRLHSHASTHARSQTLIHTRMHTLACKRTI
jgi:ankyrin repeat protein